VHGTAASAMVADRTWLVLAQGTLVRLPVSMAAGGGPWAAYAWMHEEAAHLGWRAESFWAAAVE
jgi:hypothetical protein